MTNSIEQLPSVCLIYGAGGFGRELFDLLNKCGTNVLGFIDSRVNADDVSPSSSAAFSIAGDIPILLGVFSPQPDVRAIDRDLRMAGFTQVISPAALMHILRRHHVSFRKYWLSSDDKDLKDLESNASLFRSLLSDHKSQVLFDDLVEYRLHGEVSSSPEPELLSDQYVGMDLNFFASTKEGLIVDCGAYTGDSILNWRLVGFEGRTVLALEPDSGNFRQLTLTCRELDVVTTAIPVGVAKQSGQFELRGEGPSTQLVESENGTVPCVAIDDLVINQRVSLIKMDIEGGELDALRGAHETIFRNKPHLAISVYHNPSDLWRIGQWLAALNLNYEFHLRCYGHQGYDVVLYARIND
jgi:FkbM family methyltransferase